MTEDDVDARVRSILSDMFGLDSDEINQNTSSDTVEKWDSLQHLTLVLSLEEEFGIQLDDEETLAVVSFPLITTIIRDHLKTAES